LHGRNCSKDNSLMAAERWASYRISAVLPNIPCPERCMLLLLVLILWSGVIMKLVKKLPHSTFCRIWNFITVFTRAYHLT
jgi:hypothetical protein